jgi:predicted PhzF superfamily epimerase YddE/YHI9
MNLQVSISPGTRVRIGRPACPNRRLARSIARSLLRFPGIEEAHFPQCFVPSTMSTPAQVLVIVLDERRKAQTLEFLNAEVARLAGPGTHVDVWPINATDPFLETVRQVRCRIFRRSHSGKTVIEYPWSFWNEFVWRLHVKVWS